MNPKQIRTLITLALVIVAAVAFTATTGSFLSPANLSQLLRDSAYVGTVSIGMCIVMISGNIDLSAGGIICFAGCICARLANAGLNVVIVVLVTILIGLGLGWFNAFMVNNLHLTPFVATLASGFVYSGLGLVFAFRDNHGRIVNQMIKNPGFSALANKVGIIYISVIVWAVLVAVIYFLQKRTKLGMHIYAMGSNENAAKMSGVQLFRNKRICYMACGFFCSVAAVFTVAYNQTATPSLGTGYEFQAIAACVVGGIAMAGGGGNAIGAALGSIFMTMLTNGLLKFGMGSDWMNILTGGIIIVATGFDAVFNKITNARLQAQNS